jgi:lipopolysaccharide transport system permease protein
MSANSEEIEIVITPGASVRHYWRDIWRYRELFYILSWRDIKVRYKQTIIGAAWSIIRPLLTTLIFTVIFGRIAGLKNPGAAPYALMVFAGMLPWQFFSNSLSESSNSLIGNANLITKVYFPRMIIPSSAVITSLVDLAISFLIMLGLMVYYGFMPSWNLLFLPAFIVILFLFSLGTGLYLTAVNVKYRDFRYIIPFIIQFGLYVTPVGFSSSVIRDEWEFIYFLNPMVGIIDGFRWCLLAEPIHWRTFSFSLIMVFLLLWAGLKYFRRMEKSFADSI